MIIELGNKKQVEYLYYKINNEEFNFYYKDILLFQNNKLRPFISIILQNNGVKKEIPLFNCDIKKQAENNFIVDFYNKNHRVKGRIILKNNIINIYLIKNEDYQIKICLINGENNKIVGFGCNNIDNWQGKTIALQDKEINSKDIILAKKLCFYMQNKYIFYNKNIKDWSVKVSKDVVIQTGQNEVFFALQVDGVKEIFNEAYNNKNNYKFLKSRDIIKIKKLAKYDGIIIKNNYFDSTKIINNSLIYGKHNKKILLEITPYFCITSKIYGALGEQEKTLIYSDKNLKFYTYNFNNTETVRKVKNLIRSYLNSNINGFYSMEKLIDKSNIYYKKEYGIKWKKIIEEVFKEYPSKLLIYDKLEEKKINGIYKIPVKKGMKNKDKFKYSLVSSGVYDVIYEEDGILQCH